MIGVGVVGAGTMGRQHAASYSEIPDARVLAVLDVDKGRADDLAQTCGARSFDDPEAFFEREDLSIVDVCTPTPYHREYVLRACEARKHVVCEKPLSLDLEEAGEMSRSAHENGVKLGVAHVLRYFPEYRRARQLIDAGAIGSPGVAHAVRRGPFPRGTGDWFAEIEASGGVLMDMSIHDLDFLRWCFGEVERVYARWIGGEGSGQVDYVLATLRFRNGTIGHVEGSWAHSGEFTTQFDIAGDRGLLQYDSREAVPLRVRVVEREGGQPGVVVPESPLDESPYTTELKDFIRSVREDALPPVTAEDAIETLRVGLAAMESARTRSPVIL